MASHHPLIKDGGGRASAAPRSLLVKQPGFLVIFHEALKPGLYLVGRLIPQLHPIGRSLAVARLDKVLIEQVPAGGQLGERRTARVQLDGQ